MSLLVFYLLTSWLPTLMKDAGLELSQASVVTAMLATGGTIGAIVLGRMMDRIDPHYVLAGSYILAALFIGLIGYSTGSAWMLAAVVFGAGFACRALRSASIAGSELLSDGEPCHGRVVGKRGRWYWIGAGINAGRDVDRARPRDANPVRDHRSTGDHLRDPPPDQIQSGPSACPSLRGSSGAQPGAHLGTGGSGSAVSAAGAWNRRP